MKEQTLEELKQARASFKLVLAAFTAASVDVQAEVKEMPEPTSKDLKIYVGVKAVAHKLNEVHTLLTAIDKTL